MIPVQNLLNTGINFNNLVIYSADQLYKNMGCIMLDKFTILEVYIFVHYYAYKCIICINSSTDNIELILPGT